METSAPLVGSVMIRHFDVCPIANIIVGGCSDKLIRVWCLKKMTLLKTIDITQGRDLNDIRLNNPYITCIAVRGRWAVVAECDRIVRLYNIETGMLVMQSPSTFIESYCLAISDTNFFAPFNHAVAGWSIESGLPLRSLVGHSNAIKCMSVCGDKICTGSYDATARVWDISSGICSHILTGHTNAITSIHATTDRVFTGSRDESARIWDMASGLCLHRLKGHRYSVHSITVSEHHVFTHSEEDCLKIWDIGSGGLLQTKDFYATKIVYHEGSLIHEADNRVIRKDLNIYSKRKLARLCKELDTDTLESISKLLFY